MRALALIIFEIILAISMIAGGTALVEDQNLLGLLLLLAGVALTMSILGGPLVLRGRGWYAVRRADFEEEEQERRRRTGEAD